MPIVSKERGFCTVKAQLLLRVIEKNIWIMVALCIVIIKNSCSQEKGMESPMPFSVNSSLCLGHVPNYVLYNTLAIAHPVLGPNTIYFPPQVFQDALPDAVIHTSRI